MGKRIEHRIIDGAECKHCYKCGEWKPLSEFNKCKSNRDGLQAICKECRHSYRQEHSEEIKEELHKYYLKRKKKRKENLKYTVYLRTNIVNGMQYVGQSEDLERRESDWVKLNHNYANDVINKDREKYGLDNFKLEILAVVDSRQEAWELEEKYIKELNTRFPNGYNLAKGGGGSSGITPWNKGLKNCFSEETKKRMSESHIGNEPWNKGIKGCFSDKTIKKMSDVRKEKHIVPKTAFKKGNEPWNKGVKNCFSDETNKKRSENLKGKHISPSTEFKKGMTPWMKGRKMSDEHREKDRLAHLGKISKKRKPVVQLTLEYKFVNRFTHCMAAAEAMGFKSDESIRKACYESWRTSGGFKWMFEDDYEKMLEEQLILS